MAVYSSNKKIKHTPRFLKIISTIVFVIAIIFVLGTSAFQIYHSNRYRHFWVNGQSMYPTLNKDAKLQNGNLIGEIDPSDSSKVGCYDIDYGYMDESDEAIDNLERFNIIVCSYSTNPDTNVIKRVIAFPGETFYITASSNYEDNGNLYIKNESTQEFELVEQPVDDEYVHRGSYSSFTTIFNVPYTLGKNEYFVMGDNRKGNNSSDSRKPSNKVYRENISGKVIGLEAHCTIGRDDNNKLTAIKIKHYLPWRSLT